MENKIKHLGMIMDGNRRWAKKNKMKSILVGHENGAKKLLEVCEWCEEVGIPYLSVYAFSTENWNRSKEEIDGLFQLMEKFFKKELDNCIKQGIRIRIVGNRDLLDDSALEIIDNVEAATSQCSKLMVNIALSYGGRDEILRAIRVCSEEVIAGKIASQDITEKVFSRYLDTSGCPDFDMVIRTGGNHRLSNFFPWQTVYSELYFIDTLWPDFTRAMFDEALHYYESVQINKGK